MLTETTEAEIMPPTTVLVSAGIVAPTMPTETGITKAAPQLDLEKRSMLFLAIGVDRRVATRLLAFNENYPFSARPVLGPVNWMKSRVDGIGCE